MKAAELVQIADRELMLKPHGYGSFFVFELNAYGDEELVGIVTKVRKNGVNCWKESKAHSLHTRRIDAVSALPRGVAYNS